MSVLHTYRHTHILCIAERAAAAAAAASRCKRHENRSQRNALAVHYARAGPWETRDRRKQSAPRWNSRRRRRRRWRVCGSTAEGETAVCLEKWRRFFPCYFYFEQSCRIEGFHSREPCLSKGRKHSGSSARKRWSNCFQMQQNFLQRYLSNKNWLSRSHTAKTVRIC